jgi:two-component system chemotaxis sensor kinase CheA
MDSRQYAELFLTESREHIAAVNRALLEVERDATGAASSTAVSAIFRAVHTIKGMAGTMGYTVVAELAHELETALDGVRRQALAIDGALIDLLFRSADVLERCAEAAVAGEDADPGTADLVSRLRVLTARQPDAQPDRESTPGARLDAPGRLELRR